MAEDGCGTSDGPAAVIDKIRLIVAEKLSARALKQCLGTGLWLLAILLIGMSVRAEQADNASTSGKREDYQRLSAASERAVTVGTWAVDPTKPGPDLPEVGYSLFDALFGDEQQGPGSYRIPFPFTELVEALKRTVNRGHVGRDGIKQVLIPLGRSLQRHAAAPDYFRYPRIVLAVDSESSDPDVLFLKDRLFLGYQAKANVIEVISYNEAAGRFEFQLVRNYAAGLTPQVFYARRTICISCHQNAGPIFAKAAWSETPANPSVARRLLDLHGTYSGVAVNQSANTPFAIDEATNRANLLPVYQLLWGRGCGGSRAAARSCRAALFTAALQYRLTSRDQYETRSMQYRERFLTVFRKNWDKRWPQGIKIPTADIPNRDPIATEGRISAQLDPLTPRSPLEHWSAQRPGDVDRMIAGIAEFLTAASIHRLDRYLYDAAQSSVADVKRRRSRCVFDVKNLSAAASRISFICAGDTSESFNMAGRLYVKGDAVTDGVIDELHVDGVSLKRLEFPASAIQSNADSWRVWLPLFQQRTGLHARLPSGNAVQAVEFDWAGHNDNQANAVLYVLHDFAPVHSAVARLADEANQGVFATGTLRGARIMDALFKTLGAPFAPAYRYDAAKSIPRPSINNGSLPVIAAGSATFVATSDTQVFFRYCASCHQSEVPFPPNFLYGNLEQVAANLTQCAPRIGYRLQMWQLPEAQRVKSPMPPITAVHGSGLSAEGWPQTLEFTHMQKYVADLLQLRRISYSGLLARDYTTLPECMRGSG